MSVLKTLQSLLNMHIEQISADLSAINRNKASLSLQKIPEDSLNILCEVILPIFQNEPSLLEVTAPVTIIGDLHGQIFDLYQILRHFDLPPKTKYLFLGDLVDRGPFSIQVISLVFTLKVLYPEDVYIIRGNHEFHRLSMTGGFFNEVVELYGNQNLFDKMNYVFNYLPLAATIGPYLCIHAGLSPDFRSLSQIKDIKRPVSDYDSPILSGILWSDPSSEPTDFSASRRGFGFYFNYPPLQAFLNNNKLKAVIRGHECVDGIKTMWNESLITVFSASNYCGVSNNKCGVLFIDDQFNMRGKLLGPYRFINKRDTSDSPFEFPSPITHQSSPSTSRMSSTVGVMPSRSLNYLRMIKTNRKSRVNGGIATSLSNIKNLKDI